MFLLIFEDFFEQEGRRNILLFGRHLDDLPIHFDRFNLRLCIKFEKLLQALPYLNG